MKKVISLIIIIFWTNYIHAQQESGIREELIGKVLKLYQGHLYDHMSSQDNTIRIKEIFYSDTVLVFNDIPNSHMKKKNRELTDYLEEIKEVKSTRKLSDSTISIALDYEHLFMCTRNDTSIFIKKTMQIGNDTNTHWLKINISYFPHAIPSNQWKITKIEESALPQDKDSDYVPDYCDAEPEMKGNINNMGRPIIIDQDQDKDGIIDKNDKCPKEYGGKETEGCPDKDGDGVPDYTDKCPEEKGGKETEGCPDTDNDGIPDHKDKCPEQKGVHWREGCPEPPTQEADTDNDGIPDKYDLCLEEYGKKELLGCPDKDGDGIPDKDDDCANEYGSLRTKGCPDRDNDGIPDKKRINAQI
ncbi:MAG: thrombospondin type 3 repeat-containing protein [Haliscomenobacter sp.]|nr:thrombospondin type 3 repeat-containing protein [Haliscomenobacter sp.]